MERARAWLGRVIRGVTASNQKSSHKDEYLPDKEYPLPFVILSEAKNHYVGVTAWDTDSSLRSE